MNLQKTPLQFALLCTFCGSALAAPPWLTTSSDYANTEINQSITISVLENDIGEEKVLISVDTGTQGGSVQISSDKP